MSHNIFKISRCLKYNSILHKNNYYISKYFINTSSFMKVKILSDDEQIVNKLELIEIEEDKNILMKSKENNKNNNSNPTIINIKNNFKIEKDSKQFNDTINNDKTESFIKDDPDTFGTLTKKLNALKDADKMKHEEDDEIEENFINDKEQIREHNKEYAKRIAIHIEQNQIVEALKVLEVEMKDVKARPANYIYTLLIGGCGRIGYTQKAFKLYSDMKKRGLKVTSATYTGLINACANSRKKEEGTAKLQQLRKTMRGKQYEPNLANYNAMIKAFGRHGKLLDAFSIVDEMLEYKVEPDNSTYNFLLQACITDKIGGFRHALLVWNKMRSQYVTPDIYSFNLMLRAARECGLGDEESTKLVIETLVPSEKRLVEKSENISSSQNQPNNSQEGSTKYLSFEEAISEELPETCPETNDQSSLIENRPNLIATQPHLGNIVSIGEIKNPGDRLLLIGGIQGVLNEMSLSSIKPDVKTFTLLLDCCSPSIEGERQLLNLAKEFRIELDTEFFNMLIKRRCFRRDYSKARDVLAMFQEYRIQPDLITYGCVALSCESPSQAKTFIQDLHKSGYRLNKEILSGILNQACYNIDVHYVMDVLTWFNDYEIQPDVLVIEKLDRFIKSIKGSLQQKKQGQILNIRNINAPWFNSEFNKFLNFHQAWMRKILIEEDPPYEQQFKYDKKYNK